MCLNKPGSERVDARLPHRCNRPERPLIPLLVHHSQVPCCGSVGSSLSRRHALASPKPRTLPRDISQGDSSKFVPRRESPKTIRWLKPMPPMLLDFEGRACWFSVYQSDSIRLAGRAAVIGESDRHLPPCSVDDDRGHRPRARLHFFTEFWDSSVRQWNCFWADCSTAPDGRRRVDFVFWRGDVTDRNVIVRDGLRYGEEVEYVTYTKGAQEAGARMRARGLGNETMGC